MLRGPIRRLSAGLSFSLGRGSLLRLADILVKSYAAGTCFHWGSDETGFAMAVTKKQFVARWSEEMERAKRHDLHPIGKVKRRLPVRGLHVYFRKPVLCA